LSGLDFRLIGIAAGEGLAQHPAICSVLFYQ